MDLPQVPLPIIGSLLLFWLLIRALVQAERRPPAPMLALLALCAAQGVILTAAVGWSIEAAWLLSPVTAAGVPALAWAGFMAARGQSGGLWPHAIGPAAVALAALIARPLLDPVLVALFVFYGGAILWSLRGGADALGALALDGGERPVWLWRVIAGALILSGLGDAAISLGFALGLGDWRGWLIGVNYTLFLAGIGALSLALDPAPKGETANEFAPRPTLRPTPEDTARDAEIHARALELLHSERLYLDPGLTLARLARRLRLPEKTLSGAVNRHTGTNVSRLVNDLRIDHACALIAAGQPVTESMLEAGFNTKSNFNRAFRLARGTTPTAWRDGLARPGGAA